MYGHVREKGNMCGKLFAEFRNVKKHNLDSVMAFSQRVIMVRVVGPGPNPVVVSVPVTDWSGILHLKRVCGLPEDEPVCLADGRVLTDSADWCWNWQDVGECVVVTKTQPQTEAPMACARYGAFNRPSALNPPNLVPLMDVRGDSRRRPWPWT